MESRHFKYFVMLFSFFIMGCSNTKHLAGGELLYIGGSVKVIDTLIKNKERNIALHTYILEPTLFLKTFSNRFNTENIITFFYKYVKRADYYKKSTIKRIKRFL